MQSSKRIDPDSAAATALRPSPRRRPAGGAGSNLMPRPKVRSGPRAFTSLPLTIPEEIACDPPESPSDADSASSAQPGPWPWGPQRDAHGSGVEAAAGESGGIASVGADGGPSRQPVTGVLQGLLPMAGGGAEAQRGQPAQHTSAETEPAEGVARVSAGTGEAGAAGPAGATGERMHVNAVAAGGCTPGS